ncbi:MAG: ABC transporter permease [Candidatus Dormibacteraeota bacterium]|nr:ABC transporter permease [Candidatus Dormibacteraeota bacterium]
MSIPASGTTDLVAARDVSERLETGRPGLVRNLLRHRSAVAGLSLLGLYLLVTLVGPLILHSNPSSDLNYQNLHDAFEAPSRAHLLGTDNLGRDELVRLMYGARYTLLIAIAAVALGLAVGVPLGVLSGYFGGWVDMLVQRFVDIVLAFPAFLLALSLVAVLGPGLRNVIISVGITSFPSFARLLRASALSAREQPYVEAARALGVPSAVIMVRHVIPNCLAPIVVQATLWLGQAIIVAAGLGFLGVGVQQPAPEWGGMLGASRDYIFSDSLLVTLPGLCIFGVVLAFNLVGDALRDVLDPRLKT